MEVAAAASSRFEPSGGLALPTGQSNSRGGALVTKEGVVGESSKMNLIAWTDFALFSWRRKDHSC